MSAEGLSVIYQGERVVLTPGEMDTIDLLRLNGLDFDDAVAEVIEERDA